MPFIIANLVSAGAFKRYKTVDQVMAARPGKGRKYRKLRWDPVVLDKPVFPQWSVDGPKDNSMSDASWGAYCAAWEKRANLLWKGMHSIRREILIRSTMVDTPLDRS